jgi:YbgC/YbaW family acyl-CoA thioester hydrolase
MACDFKLVRRVEFSDTDTAGIVHHSVYFRYMEAAEHAFFRSLGFSVFPHKAGPRVGWPRVHCECDFSGPLRFEDEVEIHLLVARKKSKSLAYQFRLHRLNGSERCEVARGSMVVVCVKESGGRMQATKIPRVIADSIQVAPKTWLA